VIADGPVRDVDEARALDFPVFARSATARTARARIVEAATDGPITVGDVTVSPGDYALADGSGVVFLAAAEASRIIATAEEIAAREASMGRALKEGRRITEVMGAEYEHMLKR
jgi:4-hydroxy-4-methyl-2-oxoglutarate aldolase